MNTSFFDPSVLEGFLRKLRPTSLSLRWWARPAAALLLILASGGPLIARGGREFAHPDRISYDSHCLRIDGKDVFIYSGAFHYFRCPKELWADRFQKIKDAGFNCVETYVAWNWSEREMPSGVEDFSKMHLEDLDAFLAMAEKFGLYVIVRPGPYICAEWDTGGYPRWLLTLQPEKPLRTEGWLRSDDPVYLAWCKHWYDAVCPVIAKHQITRLQAGSTGVILVQMENEYDYAGLPDRVKFNQVKALAQDALASGIDVPLITCWTHQVRGSQDPVMRHIFDTCNFYPRWDVNGITKSIQTLRREQPDAPLGTTELQGGWFSEVGGKLSEDQEGVTAPQINNLTLLAMQDGDTMMNYYMLFGGSNPGDWAARSLTTSYDYNAPIREWGGVGDRYQRVWAIGHMLREHGARLARASVVECETAASQKDVSVAERRAEDGSRYFFVRTWQHTEPRDGTAQVQEKTPNDARHFTIDYHLEPFGSTILYLAPGVTDVAQGEWLPNAAPAIERPSAVPAAVTITTARSRTDPGPTQWTKVRPGENFAQAGVYDNGFIFYRTDITNTAPTNLLVEFPGGDTVLASVNGERAGRLGGTAGSSTFALPAGANKVLLMYENVGHPNFGGNIGQSSGISDAWLTSNTFGAGKPIAGWRMHEVNGTRQRAEVQTDFKDDDWTPVAVESVDAKNLPTGHTAVYRAGVEIGAGDVADGKLYLTFGRIDDLGWVYVNGKLAGKTTDWARPYSFDATKLLHAGRNVVAVIVKNNEGEGGLGAPGLAVKSDEAGAALEALGRPAGVERQWWQPDLADTGWETAPIGADAGPASGGPMLKWYRMSFQLPAPAAGVWVPWRLHLAASGNGFLYFNGHAIGRYYEAGPQHDFFLPECWMNFGGKDNVIALSLRPLEKGASIQTAVVEPYGEFAEKR